MEIAAVVIWFLLYKVEPDMPPQIYRLQPTEADCNRLKAQVEIKHPNWEFVCAQDTLE